MENFINEMSGNCLGTEINGKWCKRYKKMLARGNGKFWSDDKNIYFLRKLTKEPIKISFSEIINFSTGKWHSGKWLYGYPILKIIWQKDGLSLSSGFFISKSYDELNSIIKKLNQIKNL